MSTSAMSGGARAASTPARPKPRSLWPKEHGAYGQLGLPLAAALAMGRPSVASALLVIAAVAAFATHEPWMVRLGIRGRRVAREHGGRATVVGLTAAAIAVVAGSAGLWLGDAFWAALPALSLTALLAPWILTGRERTTSGELIASAALSAASLPVAVAGGIGLPVALAAWGAWVVAFAVSTSAVRWVIARHKHGRGGRELVAVAGVATAAAGVLVAFEPVVLAAAPMVLAGWFFLARPPHPRHLRRVGWTLVATSTLTAALVVAIVRMAAPACCG